MYINNKYDAHIILLINTQQRKTLFFKSIILLVRHIYIHRARSISSVSSYDTLSNKHIVKNSFQNVFKTLNNLITLI